MALAVFAPSTLLPMVDDCVRQGYPQLRFAHDGIFVSIGLGAWADSIFEPDVTSLSASLVYRHAYTDVRWDRLSGDLSGNVTSVRVGYFTRKQGGLAGAILVGYQSANGTPARWEMSGIEVAFPIAIGFESRRLWLLYEPSYRLTSYVYGPHPSIGAKAAFRLDIWFPLPVVPAMMAFSLEFDGGMHYHDPAFAGVALSMFDRGWSRDLRRSTGG